MPTEKELNIKATAETAGAVRGLNLIKNHLTGLDTEAKKVSQQMRQFKRTIDGLIVTTGIVAAIKSVGDFDDKMRRIAIDSNMSTAEMLAFKQQILSTSIATGLSTDKVTEMGAAAYHSSKDMAFVRSEMQFMAKAAMASGASAEALGESFGDIHEKSGMAGADIEELYKNLFSFGKQKGVQSNLKDLLPSIPGLIKTFMALNPKASFAQLQSFLMESMFVGKPEVLSRAYTRMMRGKGLDIVRKSLGMGGVPDVEKVVAKVNAMFPNDTAARLNLLTKIFGPAAQDLVRLIDKQNEYNEAVKKMDAGQLYKDADVEATTFTGSMETLKAVSLEFADKALTKPISEFAKQIKNLDPEAIDNIATAMTSLGEALAFIAKSAGAINAFGDQFTILGTLAGGGTLRGALEQVRLRKEIGMAQGMGEAGKAYLFNLRAEKLAEAAPLEKRLKEGGWQISEAETKKRTELENEADILQQALKKLVDDTKKEPISVTVNANIPMTAEVHTGSAGRSHHVIVTKR